MEWNNLLTLCYLIASVTFILGLKMLSNPATARKGNLIAAFGMAIAIVGTIFLYEYNGQKLHNYIWIFGGLLIGTIAGTVSAKKVKMTAMPEMVSLFNGMGGACAALISAAEVYHIYKLHINAPNTPFADLASVGIYFTIVAGAVIGTISYTGSIIAWGKLTGRLKDYTFKGQHLVNLIVLALVIAASVMAYRSNIGNIYIPFILIGLFSFIYGILFVMPIGGADMPVVISLLNSFTGVAAACGGFLYNNKAMLTGGILVGAAGTLLTILMCKAMNRSLTHVLIGSFGANHKNVAAGVAKAQGNYKEISLADAAMVMGYAHKVIIVPGYGLAVAQAQHSCHELEKILNDKGVEVIYAIHPVAGRMPGHMNVLLAEADVSYDKLLEMEHANDEFKTADVVLILGANDVVNPAAKNDPDSPIYGMPILEVEQAKAVIVNKRSMKPGYAGIENDLFFQPKTSMLF
ncbi:MAG: NAD(P)(+) transhydrogenase (Re/Si-specific) subunit beta, partial [Ferruginibacter sp.]